MPGSEQTNIRRLLTENVAGDHHRRSAALWRHRRRHAAATRRGFRRGEAATTPRSSRRGLISRMCWGLWPLSKDLCMNALTYQSATERGDNAPGRERVHRGHVRA
jgi:hypothetical protein